MIIWRKFDWVCLMWQKFDCECNKRKTSEELENYHFGTKEKTKRVPLPQV